jgi:prevent-host-death family protein
MIRVNIHKAKATFSKLLQRVSEVEEFVIFNRGTPVARLIPILQNRGHRPLGFDKDRAHITDDFDAPLPPDILAGFLGNPSKRKKR